MNKQFNALSSELHDKLEDITKDYAFKFLEYYRELIRKHNYSRHKLTIVAGMGVQSVLVDGEFLFDRPNWKSNKASKLLWDIEESMCWEWAVYIDGESLN